MCDECGADVIGNPWAQHYGSCSAVMDNVDDRVDQMREEQAFGDFG